jgi:hypothetical protein
MAPLSRGSRDVTARRLCGLARTTLVRKDPCRPPDRRLRAHPLPQRPEASFRLTADWLSAHMWLSRKRGSRVVVRLGPLEIEPDRRWAETRPKH